MQLHEWSIDPKAELTGEDLLQNLTTVQRWYARRSPEVGAGMFMDDALNQLRAYTGSLILVRRLSNPTVIGESRTPLSPYDEFLADSEVSYVEQATGTMQAPRFGRNVAIELVGHTRWTRSPRYYRFWPLDSDLLPQVNIEILEP